MRGWGPRGSGSIPGSPTIQDFLKIWKRLFARSAPQGRGYARIFPYISGLNQRAGEARTELFYPAFGGSFQFFPL